MLLGIFFSGKCNEYTNNIIFYIVKLYNLFVTFHLLMSSFADRMTNFTGLFFLSVTSSSHCRRHHHHHHDLVYLVILSIWNPLWKTKKQSVVARFRYLSAFLDMIYMGGLWTLSSLINNHHNQPPSLKPFLIHPGSAYIIGANDPRKIQFLNWSTVVPLSFTFIFLTFYWSIFHVSRFQDFYVIILQHHICLIIYAEMIQIGIVLDQRGNGYKASSKSTIGCAGKCLSSKKLHPFSFLFFPPQ